MTSILLVNFIAGGSEREKDGDVFTDLLIFPDLASYNNSCDRNATLAWSGVDGRQAVLRAITDIEKGKEITNWHPSEESLESRYGRRLKRWQTLGGFWYLCQVCDVPIEEILKSNERRQEIGQLLTRINRHKELLPSYLESRAVADLQSCKRVADLLKEECPNAQDVWLASQVY